MFQCLLVPQITMLPPKLLSIRQFSHRAPPRKKLWERFGFVAFTGGLYLVAFAPAIVVLKQEKKAGYPNRGM